LLFFHIFTFLIVFVDRIQLGTVHHHGKEKLGFSDSKNFTQIHVSFICKKVKDFNFQGSNFVRNVSTVSFIAQGFCG
jgi:hypothetical protein